MSYSEYINIYKVSRDINFEEVRDICKLIYKPKLSGGYWEDNKDIFNHIWKQLVEAQYSLSDKDSDIFEFCNHDGENDKEVHKCYRIFVKVLNALDGCLIKQHSQYNDTKVIYDEDNYEYSKKGIKDYEEDFYELKEFLKKENLLKQLENKKEFNIDSIKKTFI